MPSDLEIPRFRREFLNPHVAPARDGDAFQQFVAELLLPEYSGLHAYPAGGRDGGIDLVWPADAPDVFFECKHTAEDGLEAAEARWREVEGHLREHLADPARPGQSQYAPWYATDPPVRTYVFCLSSLLQNHSQRKKLKARIRTFFTSLSTQHAHLRHLGEVEVRIRDWEDWRTLLLARPHLLFRWFPNARPRGLLPLDADPIGTGFREYLTQGRLPYYSRSEHKTRVPPPVDEEIPDEEELLEKLQGETFTGLVITGGGGLGKTRLMLELGRLAASRGWTALRVQGKIREESVERLAERLTPDTPTLLLIDYIETQPDYGTLIETLDLLVDERHIPLRYIACCRSSFYPSIQGIGRHRRIDLSPYAGGAGAWLEGFREATVRHIVHSTGLPSPERVEALSRGTPVLAVFAAWLQAQGKTGDLADLLAEPDFGAWVHKRVRQTFGSDTVGRDLARLAALLPLNDRAVSDLGADSQALLDRLALDGWVGRQPFDAMGGMRWEAAHDVLADRVALSYLEQAPASSRAFIQDLFDTAASLDTVGSALTSLQRIGHTSHLQALPWKDLLQGAMERSPEAWREARLMALRSPLLSWEERVFLLGSGASAWDGIENDVDFQNVLGWLIRKFTAADTNDDSIRAILLHWLYRAAPYVSGSNFLLTKGLLFSPSDVRDEALKWLRRWPLEFQTHYLITAWLKTQETSTIQIIVQQWLSRFTRSTHASFVFRSWLDAGGQREFVELFLNSWLKTHGESLQAQFVFKPWLDTGGQREAVEPFLTPWLKAHGKTLQTSFVFKSWLDAGGQREIVEPFLTPWLEAHGESLQAQFVFKSWLDTGGQREVVESFLTPWLKAHGETLQTSFVFKSWLDAGGQREVVEPFINPWLKIYGESFEAQFVFKSWLDAGGQEEAVEPFINPWLKAYGETLEARFVLQPWLDAGGQRKIIEPFINPWLSAHGESLDANFVFRSWLDAGGLTEIIHPFLNPWLNKHGGSSDAGFVFRSWLDARGDLETIREFASNWLAIHRRNPEAGFIIKYLARPKDLTLNTVQDILAWCKDFYEDPDALWRLVSLEAHLLRAEALKEVQETTSIVVRTILARESFPPTTSALLALLFAILGKNHQLREATSQIFLSWLRHPSAYAAPQLQANGSLPPIHLKAQRASPALYIREAIKAGTLSVAGDRDALLRFFKWVRTWEPETRTRVRNILEGFVTSIEHGDNDRNSSD